MALRKLSSNSKSSLHMPSLSILNKVHEHPHVEGRQRAPGGTVKADVDVDLREVYFLMVHFLSVGPCQKTLSQFWNELMDHQLLPRRYHAWYSRNGVHSGSENDDGISFPLSYENLLDRYSHIDKDHLVKLLKQLLLTFHPLVGVPRRLNAADVPTLLGNGPFSLLRDDKNEEKQDRPLPHYLCWPHMRIDQVHGLHLRAIGGGFSRHHRAPSVHAACYAIAKPSTMIQKMQNIKKLRGHRSAVYCAIFDRLGRYVITGSDDRLVKFWSMETAFCLVSCRGHEGDITDLAVSSNNFMVASSSNDFVIRTWHLPDGIPISVLQGHTGAVTAIAFSPRANAVYQLLSSSDDGTCRIWDARHSQVKPRIYVPKPVDPSNGKSCVPPSTSSQQNRQIFCCAYNSNGTVFVTGSSDTFARVWACKAPMDFKDDAEQPYHEIDILSGHENDVNYVQFSGCAATSRSTNFDGSREDLGLKCKNLGFFPDNIVTCSRDGSAIIWIPRSRRSHGKVGRWMRAYHLKVPPPPLPPQPPRGGPRQRILPTPRGVNMIVWSLDNRFVLAAIMDCRICVWNASDGSLVHSLTGHSDSTYVLDVHPFNPRIAMSAGYDGKTIIWDIWEGTPVRVFEIGRFKLVDGKFSPDGMSIVLSDDVGQIYLLNTGQGEAQRDAKYDQFFLGDYRPLVRDGLGNVHDQESQLPPYKRNFKDLLCDSSMIPYPEPYQTTYQRRRLGALGLDWQPSSIRFVVGPDFSSGEDYQVMPLADLEAIIDVPELLDATYWEPEIEVMSDDSDSEYNVAEEYSSEKEQESFGTSSHSETECSSENVEFEGRQKDGTRRSKKKRKKEVEFTTSGRRVKKKNLEDCEGQSSRNNMSRKSGNKPPKKSSSKAKSSRPQRVAAQNALHMFSRIPEESSSGEDMDVSQSDSSASESFSPSLMFENGEPDRWQQDLYKGGGGRLSHESAEATEPTELPVSQGNVGERRRLVLKFSVRDSKNSLLAGPSSSKNRNQDQLLSLCPSTLPLEVKDSGPRSISADTSDLRPPQSTNRIKFKFKSRDLVEPRLENDRGGNLPGISGTAANLSIPGCYEGLGTADLGPTTKSYPASDINGGSREAEEDEGIEYDFMRGALPSSDRHSHHGRENSQSSTKIKIRSGRGSGEHPVPVTETGSFGGDMENLFNASEDYQCYDSDVDCSEPETDVVRRTRSMEMKATSREPNVVNHKLKLRKGGKLVGTSKLADNPTKGWNSNSNENAKVRSNRNKQGTFYNDEQDSAFRPSSSVRKTSWLMLSEQKPSHQYIPQLGDEVVYLRQGHQEYIGSSHPYERGPWITMKGKLNAVEFCTVEGLDYATLAGSGKSYCKISLKFTSPSSNVVGRAFKLTLPDLVNFPDFLVEKTWYDSSVSKNWTPGDKCLVWWRNEVGEGGSWWEGQIISSRIHSNDFPDSPWEKHIIKYKNDPAEYAHCPWELHGPDDDWEHPHVAFEIRKLLLSCFSELERSVTRNQDSYGVQKLKQVSQKLDFFHRYPVPLSPEIIQSRLEHSYYRSFAAVKHDIQVMIFNAQSYFSKNADATVKISRLDDFFRRKLRMEDNLPPHHNRGSSHEYQFSQTNRNNIQWPRVYSLHHNFMHPFNHSQFFQQHRDEQRNAQFSGAYPTYPTPPTNNAYVFEDEHDHSQPSYKERPSQATEENSIGGKAVNWSILEDTRLCNAWVRISTDPITGNNRRKRTFWCRVFSDFVTQHGKKEVVRWNQKGCELRMQFIRGELNKWSAALKKVHDRPRSGANALMEEHAAHAFYKGQNGGEVFKLVHCWVILSKHVKFTQMPEAKGAVDDVENSGTPSSARVSLPTPCILSSARSSPSTRPVEENIPEFTREVHPEDYPDNAARPPGRKTTKERRRAKRQSSEAHSSVGGERVAKSLDDLHTASSEGWQRANEVHEEERRDSFNAKRLQMITQMMTFEREMILAQKGLYELEATTFGNPIEKALVVADKKRRLAQLQAHADGLMKRTTTKKNVQFKEDPIVI